MTGPALIMMLEYAKELCTFTLFGIVGVFFPYVYGLKAERQR